MKITNDVLRVLAEAQTFTVNDFMAYFEVSKATACRVIENMVIHGTLHRVTVGKTWLLSLSPRVASRVNELPPINPESLYIVTNAGMDVECPVCCGKVGMYWRWKDKDMAKCDSCGAHLYRKYSDGEEGLWRIDYLPF